MDLNHYVNMTPDQRAELDDLLKRQIVQAIAGRWVAVTDCWDPVALGRRIKAADACKRLPVLNLEPDERSERFFHDRKRTARRTRR